MALSSLVVDTMKTRKHVLDKENESQRMRLFKNSNCDQTFQRDKTVSENGLRTGLNQTVFKP